MILFTSILLAIGYALFLYAFPQDRQAQRSHSPRRPEPISRPPQRIAMTPAESLAYMARQLDTTAWESNSRAESMECRARADRLYRLVKIEADKAAQAEP